MGQVCEITTRYLRFGKEGDGPTGIEIVVKLKIPGDQALSAFLERRRISKGWIYLVRNSVWCNQFVSI